MSRANEADQGQPSTRRPGTFTDQHGRVWSAPVEKSTGYPVGAIKPRGWRAPWIPPQGPEVFVFSKDNPTVFTINYEFLLSQRVKDLEEKLAERQSAAVVRGWDPSDPEKQEALDKITGPMEGLNRPEIIAACIQGDKWILGLTEVVNPKVAQYLPKKQSRVQKIMSQMPDFSVPDEDAAERYMDLEEEHDAEGVGSQRQAVVPMKPKRKPKEAA